MNKSRLTFRFTIFFLCLLTGDALAQSNETKNKESADNIQSLQIMQDLQSQLATLRNEVQQRQIAQQSYDELLRKIDEYEQRISTLETQLNELKVPPAPWPSLADQAELPQQTEYQFENNNRTIGLGLHGLLQSGYFGSIHSGSLLGPDTANFSDERSFLLRRANLLASGYVINPRLRYRMDLDFGSVDPGPLLEGFADLAMHDLLAVRIGKQKIPFARQFIVPSSLQLFNERSNVTMSFAAGWDVGMMLHGKWGKHRVLSYQAGVFNGAGSSSIKDNNLSLLYLGRITFEPFGEIPYVEGGDGQGQPRLALGATFYYNRLPTDAPLRFGSGNLDPAWTSTDRDLDGTTDQVEIYSAVAELTMTWRRVFWQNELFFRRERPQSPETERTFWGGYSQPSVDVWRRLVFLGARFSYAEPNFYGQARTIALPDKIYEAGAVLQLKPFRQLFAVALEYDHQWLSASTEESRLHLFRLGLQLSF